MLEFKKKMIPQDAMKIMKIKKGLKNTKNLSTKQTA